MFNIMDIFKKQSSNEMPITTWKEVGSGRIRWLASYSSNYLDDDYPRDIISKDAHTDFINRVNSGEYDYPVLQLWHLKGTDIGKADYLFYDDELGIAMATGYVYDNKEKILKNLSRIKDTKLGMSHGMIFVERDEKDKKTINKYVTIELSILPLVAAANKMTSIYILDKEKDMMSSEQKEFLKRTGMSDEDIVSVEERNKAIADENSSRERKSVEEPAQDTEIVEQVGEVEQAAEEQEPVEQPEGEAKEAGADLQFVTVEQMKSTLEYMVGLINERMDAVEQNLVKSVEEIKEKSAMLEKSVNDKVLSPGSTLEQVIHKSFIEKSIKKSASEAEVRPEDPLYKDAPEETEPPADNALAGVVSKIIGAKL